MIKSMRLSIILLRLSSFFPAVIPIHIIKAYSNTDYRICLGGIPVSTQLADTVILKASRLKWASILAICLIFGLIGIWMLSSGENKFMSWLCIIFFGLLGGGVCFFQLISPGKLVLNRGGFEQKMTGRSLQCKWQDVSEFGVIRISRNKFVSFSRLQDEGKAMTQISKAITGSHSGMLGDNFGMKSEDLADLMNAFRNRALSL